MPKVGMQPIRRQQLIEATMAAVNEVGMHEASIAQIAKRAGVSNGIISHYFRDKNGLLEATMRYLIRHLGEAVKQHLAALSVNDPRARLRAIAEGNFDDSQINSAAMKTWLAFWASSMHSPQLYRLQQVNN
ncbi:transcriptional regulator BetI, partial [Yersinia pestis]